MLRLARIFATMVQMFSEMQQRLQESASEMLSATSDKIVEIVPLIALAFIVLIVGAVAAGLARNIVLRVADFIGLDKLAAKVNVDRALRVIGLKSSFSRILGFLVYWLIVLFALLLVSEVLKLGTVSQAIGSIVAYIPDLIGGLLILVIGLLVGRFFRDVVSTSLARAGIAASEALGIIVQAVVIIFVCLLALRQVGFNVDIITTNLAVILGVVLVSVGLATAIAIRPVLENVFVCRQLKQFLRKGDHIDFDGVKGEVKEISLTSVIVHQGSHDVVIPARQLFEQRFLRQNSGA
jgi:hypothetical protein